MKYVLTFFMRPKFDLAQKLHPTRLKNVKIPEDVRCNV